MKNPVFIEPLAAMLRIAGRRCVAQRLLLNSCDETIMLIEASGLGINWMEPRDVSMEEAIKLLTVTPQSGHTAVRDTLLKTTYESSPRRHVAYCDGHIQWLGQLRDAEIAKALLMINDGETLPSHGEFEYVESYPTEDIVVTKWDKVLSLSVFVILALMPAARLIRFRASNSETDDA